MPETPVKAVEAGATHKLGPLPVYAWVLLLTGGGLAVYFLFLRPASGSTASGLAPIGGAVPNLGGGGGGGSSSPVPPTAPVETRLASGSWLEAAVKAVTGGTGIDASRARLYLQEYLQGRQPLGSAKALNDFQRVVTAAIQYVGEPLNPPGVSGRGAYDANADYLHDLLAYLPGGTSGAVQQELIALFNGSVTAISQQAADALGAVRDVIGVEPRLLSYTINAPAPPTAPKNPVDPAPPAPTPPAPPGVVSKAFKPYSAVVSGVQHVAVRFADVALGGSRDLFYGASVVVKGSPDAGGTRPVDVYLLNDAASKTGQRFQGWLDRFGNVTFTALGNNITAINAPDLRTEPAGFGTSY